MPEGALLTHTVESVLRDLADSRATGCLLVRDPEGDEAEVFLRDGQVYAVGVPGRRVLLGVRLMSRGALTPEALAEALEIQRTELQGWRLGELLVHLGYVEIEVVEEFVVEQLKDALTDLLGWPVAAWKFRKNKKTRQDVAPPTPVAELLDHLRLRATTWETIVAATGGPAAVPTLDNASPSDEVALGPNEWALLCKVDGSRDVAELAVECGFTLFEAGQVVMRLVEAGLVSVPGFDADAVAGAATSTAAVEDLVLEQETAGELDSVNRPGAELVLPVVPVEELAAREAAERAEAARTESEELANELLASEQAAAEESARLAAERAAEAEARRVAEEDVAREAEQRRVISETKRLQEAEILHRELEALAQKEAAARAERQEARRRVKAEEQAFAEAAEAEARALAEAEARTLGEAAEAEARALAEAAEAEARALAEAAEAEARAAEEQARLDREAAETEARALAEAAEEQARLDRETAERVEAEGPAWDDHRAWLDAERAAAEDTAWTDHAAWLEAERAAVEAQAWADHADWL
ncbi:MAG: DUF4388 domain-containing protein, partial [Sporichthyaceae bacterium]